MVEPTICYILGTFPNVTTTFIDREIQMLRRWELEIRLLAMRQPDPDAPLSQEQRSYRQEATYLIPVDWPSFWAGNLHFLSARPRTYLGTLLHLLTRPHPSCRTRWKTVLHFAEAVYAARLLAGGKVDHLHAHFADRTATVALVASRLLDVPYSVATHARDIYADPVLLPEKTARAKFVVANTECNRAHLWQQLGGTLDRNRVHLVYNGLDITAYTPVAEPPPGKPLALAVGRLTEKKGFPHLVRACRLLRDRGYDLACDIVGQGPQHQELQALIGQLGLEDTVALRGAMPHEAVIEQYKRATIFVLPCIVAQDGDQDGLPNVLIEAMAMQLPVVTTHLSGIPELVQHRVNGLLVPPGEEEALAGSLAELLDNPALRRQLAQHGRDKVARDFDIQRNARTLLDLFAAQGTNQIEVEQACSSMS